MFASLILICLIGWSQQGLTHAHTYGGNYLMYLQGRLSHLAYTLNSRLSRLEQTINDLGSQQCETGTVELQTCPTFDEASMMDIVECVTSPARGAGTVIMDVTVNFDNAFTRPPIVTTTFSGLSLVQAKNCSVEVISTGSDSFTLRYVADDFLPLQTQLSYYACPAALFDKSN